MNRPLRERRGPGDDVDRSRCDLVVRMLLVTYAPHLDVHGHRPDALHPRCNLLRGQLLGIGRDMTGEGRDAIFHRHADMGGVDAGFERQLVEYVVLDFWIRHFYLLLGSEAWRPRGV